MSIEQLRLENARLREQVASKERGLVALAKRNSELVREIERLKKDSSIS